MRSSYPIEQKGPELHMDMQGKSATVNNKNLPTQLIHWTNDDILHPPTKHIVRPDNNIYFKGGETLKFSLTMGPDTFIDWSKSDITFKIALQKHGMPFTTDYSSQASANFMNPGEALAFSSMTAPARPTQQVAGDVVSYIYCKNSACLLNKMVIEDRLQGMAIETITHCGIIGAISAIGSSAEFYEQDSLGGLCDRYLAGVHTMTSDTFLKTRLADALNINGQYVNNPSYIIPEMTQATGTFNEVQAQLNEIANRTTFTLINPSDYLNTSVLQSCYYQQLGLSFTLNKYSQAFTDLKATVAAGDTAWIQTQNCDDFVIYDVQLNLHKVVLNTAVTESIRSLSTLTGWDVDMTHFDIRTQEINAGLNDAIYPYQEKKSHSVDKVFIVVQPESFYEDSALKPKFEFTTGCSHARNVIIENNPTRTVISQQYDGVSEISFNWLNQQLIYNNDAINIIPGDLGNIKRLLQECYQNDETNILRRDFEGIGTNKLYTTTQPSFIMGFDFRKIKGATYQGLDIMQSDLFIRLKFAGASHEKLRITYVFCVGSKIHVGGSKTSFLTS